MAHKHSVYDTDTHFIIDGITRAVKNASSVKTMLVQGDHNSERFTFELPRMIDGHDMSLCNDVKVHYTNINSMTKEEQHGIYVVDDLKPFPDDDEIVVCSWLISRNATQHAGALRFGLSFRCLADDGTIEYVWNTAIHTGVSVSSGMDNSDTVVDEYPDILAAFEKRIVSAENSIKELAQNGGNSASAKIGEITLLADGWVGNASPYSQVVELEGVTENSQVDITPNVEQLAIFYEKDITFVTENIGGVVTVYVIGQKPQNDYTIQVTITEVTI